MGVFTGDRRIKNGNKILFYLCPSLSQRLGHFSPFAPVKTMYIVYDFFIYAAIGFVGEGKCFFDGIKKAFTLPYACFSALTEKLVYSRDVFGKSFDQRAFRSPRGQNVSNADKTSLTRTKSP